MERRLTRCTRIIQLGAREGVSNGLSASVSTYSTYTLHCLRDIAGTPDSGGRNRTVTADRQAQRQARYVVWRDGVVVPSQKANSNQGPTSIRRELGFPH